MPEPSETLISHAYVALREERLDDAVRMAEEVLVASPGDLQAILLLGIVAGQQRQVETALALLSQVVSRDPKSVLGYYWLSTVLRRDGRPDQAFAMAKKAVALDDDDSDALNEMGLCLADLERWEDAQTCFKLALDLAPDNGSIHSNLGVALQGLGQHAEARREFRRALALDPSQAQALFRLGQSLVHDLDYAGGAKYARRLLEVDPKSVSGNLLLAMALAGANQSEEAAELAARALALAPNHTEALSLSGTILQSLGRLDEANVQLRLSLEREPRQGYAYYALVRTHKVREADAPLVAKMEEVASTAGFPRRHRGDIEYALGKAYADLGNYKASMAHYNEANRITRESKFGKYTFDNRLLSESVDAAIRSVGEAFFQRYKSAGSQDRLPIFVVGMIRSGTTLAEQILSSHPEIGGAGEQKFWSEHQGAVLDTKKGVVNVDVLRNLEDRYLALLRDLCPGKSHVIDKMPGNFALLGLLHIAFPRAKFIHLRRNPIDTCLSIWTTPNATRLEWATEKKDIVFAYKQYVRVMRHWQTVLPKETLLEVQYEDLVADPERWSRQMVEFCGLEWNAACLHPEQNTRPVATPSNWQVRQPVYRDSVERWRPYEPWLEEFRELLPKAPHAKDQKRRK